MGKVPEWLALWLLKALLGEIYPEIRAIAVSFLPEKRELKIRYYLDREPTDYDHESIDLVATKVEANTNAGNEFSKFETECVYSTAIMLDLDRLDGFMYARREYL